MAGNANSGRRPQPTQLKLLRGNPGKRRVNPAEPTLPRVAESFDQPPRELAGDAAARAEWKRIAPMLRLCGVVSQGERAALLALCQQWSRYLAAHRDVRRRGMVIKAGLPPVPLVNPYLAIADRALSHCQRLWVELGLTPSGRARIASLPLMEPITPEASKWAGLV
jgi:P27 family predicted phage terminase small subunit